MPCTVSQFARRQQGTGRPHLSSTCANPDGQKILALKSIAKSATLCARCTFPRQTMHEGQIPESWDEQFSKNHEATLIFQVSQGWLTYEILSQWQPGARHLFTPAQKYYDDDNDNRPMDHRCHWESSTSCLASNRTPKFSAAFTRSNHCTLYCAKRIYCTPISTISLGSILILTSQIRIVLRSVYFFAFRLKRTHL